MALRQLTPPPSLAVEGHEAVRLRDWEVAGALPGGEPDWADAIAGTAPGTVAGALTAAGRPTDELEERDWWYRSASPVGAASDADETVLRLDGLATHATLRLGGEDVESTGMFTPQALMIDGTRERQLEIVFRALGPVLRERHPRPRWKTRIVGEQALRWHRTQLAGRCPGFAPGPPVVGPWRGVTLEHRRRVALDRALLRPALEADGTTRLDVRLALRGLGGARVTGVVGDVGGIGFHLSTEERDGVVHATGTATGRLAPWWPHTHGEPALHPVRLDVETTAGQVRVDGGAVGFRRVEVADPDRFALVVNGTPLFVRGAALMPDALTVDADAPREERLLRLAVEAGMNMLRLSGLTHYAGERLLARADALGMLVWQDFAFANMDYPVEDEGFRALVEAEARAFLEPAASHACLAVLCGGSEVEQQPAMLGLADLTFPLLDEVLPAALAAAEVSLPYVRSTPTGGSLPFRPGTGVAHYFGVGAYRRPLEDARRADVRFAAECLAFSNPPAPDGATAIGVGSDAWERGTPRDNGADWTFADVTDHYVALLHGVDPAALRRDDPERWLALAAVTPGQVIAATLGEWRRSGSSCSGALLWWFNDVLPGPGWGLVDAEGRPKPAYWLARRASLPIAAWLTDEGTNGVAVHVANDTPETRAVTLTLTLLRADGAPPTVVETPQTLAPHSAAAHDVEALLGRFEDVGGAFGFGTPLYRAVVVTLAADGRIVSRGSLRVGGPCPHVGPPTLSVEDAGSEITVSSDGFADVVLVDGAPGLGEGCLTLLPGETVAVPFLERTGAPGSPTAIPVAW